MVGLFWTVLIAGTRLISAGVSVTFPIPPPIVWLPPPSTPFAAAYPNVPNPYAIIPIDCAWFDFAVW